ncbi:MAG: tRNA lysidine(34) synthetase TilS [Lentisphaeria bacterium]|nr:MAG: tRNA lysidine(34) synthetase TilS [Lentisphaeria bacterium]
MHLSRPPRPDASGKWSSLPGPAIWLWRSNPRLHWGKFQLELHALRSSDAPPTLFEARFDAALLPDELIVDRRRPGDRILPFGRTTELSLKKLRIDRKLPSTTPARFCASRAGGFSGRRASRHSACAPLSAATTQAVEFRLRRTDGTPLSPEVSA